MHLLNEQEIAKEISKLNYTQPYKLIILPTVDSTNRYLKDLPANDQILICCAEQQTQGRGRFNRVWHSPYGENIYCSLKINLPVSIQALSGLSLVVSLATLNAINTQGDFSEIQVKWPNDLLWGERKLSGNLIEILSLTPTSTTLIIGIGLNVNSNTADLQILDQPWCSLYSIKNIVINRNQLLAKLLIELDKALEIFIKEGLKGFEEKWNQVDSLKNKLISLRTNKLTLTGWARGINDKGELILEDKMGKFHYCSAGDTSLN